MAGRGVGTMIGLSVVLVACQPDEPDRRSERPQLPSAGGVKVEIPPPKVGIPGAAPEIPALALGSTMTHAAAGTGGAPPIGEGPWGVSIKDSGGSWVQVGEVYAYDADEDTSNGWVQFVERTSGSAPAWSWAKNGVPWKVVVGTGSVACNVTGYLKCQKFASESTSSSNVEPYDLLADPPAAGGVERVNEFHDPAKYKLAATIYKQKVADGVDVTKEAHLYVSTADAGRKRIETVCFAAGFKWPQRDDDGDDVDRRVDLDIAYLGAVGTPPVDATHCDVGFRSEYHTYENTLTLPPPP